MIQEILDTAVAEDRQFKRLSALLAKLLAKDHDARTVKQKERRIVGLLRAKATHRMIEKRYGILQVVRRWLKTLDLKEELIRKAHKEMAALIVKHNALTNSMVYGIIRRQTKINQIYFRMGLRAEQVKQRERGRAVTAQRREMRRLALARKRGLPV